MIEILVDRVDVYEERLVVWIKEKVSSEDFGSNDTMGGCPVRVSKRTIRRIKSNRRIFPVHIPLHNFS